MMDLSNKALKNNKNSIVSAFHRQNESKNIQKNTASTETITEEPELNEVMESSSLESQSFDTTVQNKKCSSTQTNTNCPESLSLELKSFDKPVQNQVEFRMFES